MMTISHSRKSSKILSKHHRNRAEIDTPNTYWIGAGTSIVTVAYNWLNSLYETKHSQRNDTAVHVISTCK